MLASADVSEIKDLLDSKKNLELLRANQEARDALSANLETAMTTGTADQQVAAAEVYLDLQLKGTGALEASNALLTALFPVLTGQSTTLDLTDPAGNIPALQSTLQDIFGSSPADITATLLGLQNMVAGYDTLSDNNSMDILSGDHLVAAPLAVLADILLTASSPEALVSFITGETQTLDDFDLTQVESGMTDLQTMVTGGAAAADSPYAFLTSLPLPGVGL